MSETQSQDLPDRAEEKRVDVPQNETPAPTETAQASSVTETPGPVDPPQDDSVSAQTNEVTETTTVRETTAGTSDDS